MRANPSREAAYNNFIGDMEWHGDGFIRISNQEYVSFEQKGFFGNFTVKWVYKVPQGTNLDQVYDARDSKIAAAWSLYHKSEPGADMRLPWNVKPIGGSITVMDAISPSKKEVEELFNLIYDIKTPPNSTSMKSQIHNCVSCGTSKVAFRCKRCKIAHYCSNQCHLSHRDVHRSKCPPY